MLKRAANIVSRDKGVRPVPSIAGIPQGTAIFSENISINWVEVFRRLVSSAVWHTS